MKKHAISILLLLSVFLQISPSFNIVHADELATETVSLENNDIKEFNNVTINYILEGVETTLKASKTLDKPDDFWDDYTIKLSNKLMFSSIDIQDTIRDYYFSHYEIAGKRIESIDTILTLLDENPVVNVVYSEEIPEDGYLRKGFRDGIAFDYNYLKLASDNLTEAHSELYDDTWSIKLSPELCAEIVNDNKDLVNANDQTLYFNVNLDPISPKEQTELTNKYNYIDSIKLTSSLGYKDYSSPIILNYSPKSSSSELENKELNLYGVNLEGKIELITTSLFENNTINFAIDKNTNKYKFLFVSFKDDAPITDETSNNEENPSSSILDKEQNNISNTIIKPLTPKDDLVQILGNKNEEKIILLILFCFAAGAFSTFLLSLIFSIRQSNIEKKKKLNKTNNES